KIEKQFHAIYAQVEKNLDQKLTAEERTITGSLGKLKGIVSDDKPALDFSEVHTDDHLLAACQLIGNEVGFDFEAPKHLDENARGTVNQLFAIGQVSNARIRKVVLRGEWWKDENGHLLAFTQEEKKPVALIQKSHDLYVMMDPETRSSIEVTEEVAAQLEPLAYMFFYAFDERMTSMKKIWNFAIKGLKKDALYIIIAALAGSLIGLLTPILSGVLFDDVIPQADRGFLFEVFIIMFFIGVVSAMLQLLQGTLLLRIETKSNINVQAALMDHLLRLPVTFYRKFAAGDLTLRALGINSLRQILSNTVLTAVLSGAFSFVNLGLLFYYDASLAWVGIGLGLVAIVFIAGIGLLKLRYDRQIADTQGDIQGFLFEFLNGITKIRVTGAEKRVFSLWANRFADLKELGFRSGNYQNFVEVFNGTYPLLTRIFFFGFLFYWMQTANVLERSLISVGAFMAFVSAFGQFLRDCLNLSFAMISSLNMVPLYERVKPILEAVPESTGNSADPGELVGEIELNSINFRYEEDQPLVLKDVSLRIKPGEMVAFVGPSGSGKSTVMRILLGFEEAESGSVYYDGQAFESLNKDLVRRQVGVVLQNGSLMKGSIYQNIVGNSDLGLDTAWEAARMAGLDEDIQQMPMEMHTVISEGGGTFSGGQRQRLMIARAIVHKPRMLFMDEATSALDNRTQNIVSESLDRLQATRIVIAHRLSTVINADRIYVMDQGQIVESGTYQELMDQGGLFSSLAKRQIA
ncbi:MAG: NHLP bacteriocin export ABC transporter permease/ATPase subunit, partial [Bacteroidota bacterium]